MNQQRSALRSLLLAAAVFCLAACAPVSYQRDEAVAIPASPSVAFAGDKWQVVDDLDPAVDDDTVHRRIQNAIVAEFESRGFTFTRSPQSADFVVRYFVALRREPDEITQSGSLARTTPTARPGWGWGWGPAGVTTLTPRDFSQDSFVVEMVERSTGRMAWQATWRGEPGSRAPSQQEVDAKMADIFRTAPDAN